MKDVIETAMKKLTEKSAETKIAGEAMQFSQAALNLAHVLATLDNLKK